MNRVVTAATLVLLATIGFSAYAYTVYLPSLSNSSTGPSSSSLGGSGSGTLNIYLTDSPHSNATLKYLLVNVTSITLKYSTEGTSTNTTTSTSSSSSSTSSSSTSSGSSSSSSSSTSSSSSSVTTSVVSSSSTSSSGDNGEARFVYNIPASKGTNINLTSLQGNALLLGAPKVPAGNVTGIILNITGARAFWTDGSWTQLRVVADGKLMADIHFEVFTNGTTNLTVDITPGGIHISSGPANLRPVILVKVSGPGQNGSTQTTETTVSESETSST